MNSPTKADFSRIYNQPDDFDYYRTLGSLDYRIPQHGADVFTRLLAAKERDTHGPATLLDVCCSYGVGGVLLKSDVRVEDIYELYVDADDRDVAVKSLVELRHEHARADAPRVIGLDIAEKATDYAVRTGALDAAFVEDLESTDPSAELAHCMRDVDMITTTGGIGYVTEQTLGRLVDASGDTPWVAAFCLREYDYTGEIEALAERGLVTEKSPQHYPQRRFVDADEQSWAIAQVQDLGLDAGGLEDTGWFYADFYLSRPAEDVSEAPLASLI